MAPNLIRGLEDTVNDRMSTGHHEEKCDICLLPLASKVRKFAMPPYPIKGPASQRPRRAHSKAHGAMC
jgi:hypothetical protein